MLVDYLLFHCLHFFVFPTRHFGVSFLLSGRGGLDLVLRAPFYAYTQLFSSSYDFLIIMVSCPLLENTAIEHHHLTL